MFRSLTAMTLIALMICLGSVGSVGFAEDSAGPARIVFGSCCKQDKPQPIWDSIVAVKPDLFLMIGDNIYGDSQDLSVLKAKWDMLGAQPGFQRLKKTCPVLATWDDHDFGADDAGVEYPMKKESQQLFLDFFDEPADSPRRKQEGVYASYEYGPPSQRVQVILLDTRYHRSPLKKSGRKKGDPGFYGPYAENTDAGATILGETQWKWLGDQLEKPAVVRIVASSVQVLPNEHQWEKWGNFPAERDRLLKLIRSKHANGVILLSGDRHTAEISRDDTSVGYPLFDITSSSLNAPGTPNKSEPNPLRTGPLYSPENFGMISIDWSASDPAISLELRNIKGEPVETQRVKLSQLRARE
jgi:alkaline phosphatase D